MKTRKTKENALPFSSYLMKTKATPSPAITPSPHHSSSNTQQPT
jgi:hypothetical protein